MERILGSLVIVISALVLISCDKLSEEFEFALDDVVDEERSSTVDIELENAELIALGVLQSTLFTHLNSRLYDFLDASDLPEDAVNDGETYFVGCDVAGSAEYTFSRPSGEAHKAGDKISVEYTDCDEGEGLVHNGKLTGRYTEIKGLNDRFVEIDTDTCLANLQKELPGNVRIIDPVDENGDPLDGDEVRFKAVAGTLVIEVVQVTLDEDEVPVDDNDDNTYTVTNSFVIGAEETAILVNRRLRQSGEEEVMTSGDGGDQIYSVVDREGNKALCQGYQRTLNVSLSNFYSKKDELQHALNGSVTLFSGTEDLNRFTTEIRESTFSTTVQQGNLAEQFLMTDYTVTETFDTVTGSYNMVFDGDISSEAIFGTTSVSLLPSSPLLGNYSEDYPNSGILSILGRGLEQILITSTDLRLTIAVDFDGDSTGNGRSDSDEFINTSWSDLIDREFEFVDY